MTYKRRKNTDVNKVIYLVKNPKTGLYIQATEEQKRGKTKSGGKKRRDKQKTQKHKKKKRSGGGNLVQATEEQKKGIKSKERTFKMRLDRGINQPILLVGDLSAIPAPPVAQPVAPAKAAPVVAKPLTPAEEEKIEEMAEHKMEENMEKQLEVIENLMPNALPIKRTAPSYPSGPNAPAEKGPAEPGPAEPQEPGPAEPGPAEPQEPGPAEPGPAEPQEPGPAEPQEPGPAEPAPQPFDSANYPGPSLSVISESIPQVSQPPVVEPSAPPVVEPSAPPVVEPSAPPVVEPSAPPVVEPSAPPVVEPSAQAAQAQNKSSRLLQVNSDKTPPPKIRKKIEGSNVATMAANYDVERGKAPFEPIQKRLIKEGKIEKEITTENDVKEYQKTVKRKPKNGGKNRTIKKKKRKRKTRR
jgi:hypothetical protein